MPQNPIAPRDLLYQVARDLVLKGWQPVWCLQRQSGGFTPIQDPMCTGAAEYPTVLPQPAGSHRLGFRPPPSLILIDVDHYEKNGVVKNGAHTLDRAEEWLGELPPTYKVTSRGFDCPSGRFIYRVPDDLVIQNSYLNQFANDNGKTDIDILRTGHRYSWAPGDIHHITGQTVQCFDPEGEPCWLPHVDDASIPELPQRWVDYLRNPPKAFTLDAYTRPGDGPQWWLQQPDNSLGQDDELKSFAFNMMLSRVPVEDIFPEWLRVSRADDPSWPWDREDFDRHTRGQAQQKAAESIAREDEHYSSMPASETELAEISQRAHENDDRLSRLQLQAIEAQYGFPVATPPDQYIPSSLPAQELDINDELRKTPAYIRQFQTEAVRGLAKRDAAYLTKPPFKGYIDIMSLGPVPDPARLIVTGSPDMPGGALIVPGTVTVMAGHRSAGKTWAAATWVAYELISNAMVTWIDYERQPVLLAEKMRMLLPNADLGKNLHYASDMPPLLAQEIPYQAAPLVVIDSWRGLQNAIAPGSTANDGDAVEQVYLEVLTPLQKAGATIVILDHLPKNGDSTFGSERKESAADYVIFVKQEVPFSREVSGHSSLTIAKDRYGHHAAGDVPGYLWVPGRYEETSRTGIKKYPPYPEFRSWAPEPPACGLDDLGDTPDKSRRSLILLDMVAADPLKLSINALAKAAHDTDPSLFKSESSIKRWIRELVSDGKLVKEDGAQGKLSIAVMEVHSPAPKIDPSVLEHPEAD
jgi:hypothetical protein